MDNSVDSWLNSFVKKYELKFKKIFWYFILVICTLRGVNGFWVDLKKYIVASEMGKETVTVTVDPKKTKYDTIREKIQKEKGIILTDEDIDKYGFNK